jgi:ribosomal protein S18 acetylase RimI-like enzyme
MISSGSTLSDWFLTDGSDQNSDDSCEIKSSRSSTIRDEEACTFFDNDSRHPTHFEDQEAMAISFRSVGPQDRVEIQRLHEIWFPVLYHDDFYDDLAAGREGHFGEPLYSCLVVNNGRRQMNHHPQVNDTNNGSSQLKQHDTDQIIASVIGTFVPASSLAESLRSVLLSDEKYSKLFYLMTLGCREEYRKEGWATTLVQRSMQHAMQDDRCGAVYLHVITYNYAAIRLYERLGFYRIKEIVNYYSIEGKKYNCFLYAKYLNGNRGHLGLINILSDALLNLWRHVITKPINFIIEATGVSNNSRLM